jgi:hypothetical protein
MQRGIADKPKFMQAIIAHITLAPDKLVTVDGIIVVSK